MLPRPVMWNTHVNFISAVAEGSLKSLILVMVKWSYRRWKNYLDFFISVPSKNCSVSATSSNARSFMCLKTKAVSSDFSASSVDAWINLSDYCMSDAK